MEGEEASGNRRTIESYEGCALDYARSTAPKPGLDDNPFLRRFREALPSSGRVLEIGSGPGWDADWLEERRVTVRRTDAAKTFVDFQRARGARAELLDVVADDIGGPYAGVIALYVFQHIERPRLPRVLAKIARALIGGGAFLFSLREGQRDFVESGESGSTYLIAEWEKSDLNPILREHDLTDRWSTSGEDADGRWLTILTSKANEDG